MSGRFFLAVYLTGVRVTTGVGVAVGKTCTVGGVIKIGAAVGGVGWTEPGLRATIKLNAILNTTITLRAMEKICWFAYLRR